MLAFFWDSAVSYLSDRLMPIIIGTVGVLLVRWICILFGILRRGPVSHEIGIGALTLYSAAVLSLTFLPLQAGTGSFQFHSTLLNILLGKHNTGAWGLSMLLGNALMFVPLGALLPMLWKWFTWPRVLLASLTAVLCIELLQPLAGRSFDIDDLFLNFLGAFIGSLLALVLKLLFPRLISAFQK